MIQELKAIFNDNRGVSPVIGVILMVAITVILAAVIGTFVLGLGDSLQQAPNAQLSASSDTTGNVSISHNGGDALAYSEITIQVNSTDVTENFPEYTEGEELSVGDTISLAEGDASGTSDWAGNTVTVTVIHQPSESILLDEEVDVQGS